MNIHQNSRPTKVVESKLNLLKRLFTISNILIVSTTSNEKRDLVQKQSYFYEVQSTLFIVFDVINSNLKTV